MDDFESKLGQILGNPEMMGKIMSMAQSFGGQETQQAPPHQEETTPDFDFATIQKLTGLMGKANVDSRQKAKLLCGSGVQLDVCHCFHSCFKNLSLLYRKCRTPGSLKHPSDAAWLYELSSGNLVTTAAV